jgi:hypothetical protein
LGLSPRFLAFHPKGCFAYVVSEDNRALYRIRPADRQIDGDLIIPKQSGKVLDLVVSNNNVVVVL